MQTRLLTRLPGMTLAVMLALVVTQGLGGGPEAQARDGRGLEGTWLNAVKIVRRPVKITWSSISDKPRSPGLP